MDAPFILCIDDSDLFLQSLQDKLTWNGYASTTTTSVRTALRLIREQPFGVRLTDFAMPEMNGVALAEPAKSIRPELKAILLTSARDLPTSPAPRRRNP